MSKIRYPAPLKPGDTIGVTAPSAGVGLELNDRLLFCLSTLREHGYQVREGQCLRGDSMASAPPQARAAELMQYMLDDSIQAVIPPWGGELLIDILPLLDFNALANARPKWVVGYSDMCTFMLPYTLLTHSATLHGVNLMEIPYHPDTGHLAAWNDVLTLPIGQTFAQKAGTRYQPDSPLWQNQPRVMTYNSTCNVSWKFLHHEDDPSHTVRHSGRLIGGCLEVISMLPASPYGDVPGFARTCAPEGLLLYVEMAEGNTAEFARMLHCIRLAGWCEQANAVLVGRSAGPQLREFTVRDALLDALGDLPVPVLYDMDIGHQPPQLLLINGALAEVCFQGAQSYIAQTLR
jgi:muramoyltetrapeptide carboxypeptidase LdcA involved in peptidoglycan recycling